MQTRRRMLHKSSFSPSPITTDPYWRKMFELRAITRKICRLFDEDSDLCLIRASMYTPDGIYGRMVENSLSIRYPDQAIRDQACVEYLAMLALCHKAELHLTFDGDHFILSNLSTGEHKPLFGAELILHGDPLANLIAFTSVKLPQWGHRLLEAYGRLISEA